VAGFREVLEDGSEVVYPDSDGQPMADNTEQFEWIVRLQGNLDWIRPDDFVGGDLLWYPVQGHPEIRVAPDTLVAPGRPKGYRGSYIQHREGGVPPKVVFEVLSPGNTPREMARKAVFYQQYGVDEFIIIDPEAQDGTAFVRSEGGRFEPTDTLDGWTSPFLGIRFQREDGRLVVYRPDGTPFKNLAEVEAEAAEAKRLAAEAEAQAKRAAHKAAEAEEKAAEAEEKAAEAEEKAAEAEEKAAEAEEKAAEAEEKAAAERAKAQRLAEKLRALGIDPDAV